MSKDECVICMETLRQPELEVYQTKCGHKFHKNCLMEYCHNAHGKEYAIYSSIKCPLCNTPLNCRFDMGYDIFPEKITNDDNIPNIIKTNVEKALDIIPEDEYELIDTPDEIFIDLSLTDDEKAQVFEEIQKRKKSKGGKKRRSYKNKRLRYSKRKYSIKKNKTKRKRNNKQRKTF